MTAFAIDYKKNTIRAFSSKSVAQKMGNGLVVFTSVDELLNNRNTTNQGIVAVYNNNTDVAVKRFSDTRTGAARLFKLAQQIHIESTPFDNSSPFSAENMGMTVKSKKEKEMNDVEVHVKSASKPKKRGRNSGYEGKMIKCLVEKNPRRQNTHGFHSMGILINAGEPVSYESYIAQGGRRQDLAWDIEKGNAEISD
jgi:hypothetical protein